MEELTSAEQLKREGVVSHTVDIEHAGWRSTAIVYHYSRGDGTLAVREYVPPFGYESISGKHESGVPGPVRNRVMTYLVELAYEIRNYHSKQR